MQLVYAKQNVWSALGRTETIPAHGTSIAAACRLLDSLYRRNHRSDSSRRPLRGLHFLFCGRNGNLESLLQSSCGNASQRNAHSVRTDFSFHLPLLLRGRELALLCSLGEFQLACNSGKALLGHLCSRQPQANQSISGEPACVSAADVSWRWCPLWAATIS